MLRRILIPIFVLGALIHVAIVSSNNTEEWVLVSEVPQQIVIDSPTVSPTMNTGGSVSHFTIASTGGIGGTITITAGAGGTASQ